MKPLKSICAGAAACTLALQSLFGRFQPVLLERKVPETIQAEIKGAVVHPGVYELKYGACIQDLIDESAGLLEQADTGPIVLSQILEDGQVVVIGTLKEQRQERISINTASLEELQKLPGIGPAMAQRILDYRKEHPFQSLEELMEVKGIGEKTFQKLAEQITL